jgi:hypothetical protein
MSSIICMQCNRLIQHCDCPCAGRLAVDPVNHPPHYNAHPSGVECIDITEHMNFCLGNAVKYVWRADLKSDNPIQDLKKAKWYIEREIARLEAEITKAELRERFSSE